MGAYRSLLVNKCINMPAPVDVQFAPPIAYNWSFTTAMAMSVRLVGIGAPSIQVSAVSN
jgi:hypothetical protein